MKRAATQTNGSSERSHVASFLPVLDSRKRKIAGLWQRGERYYAQLRVNLGNGTTAPRRFALEATNLDEAKAALERTRTERQDGELRQTGYRPKFADFAQEYVTGPILAQKKAGTQKLERWAIARWSAHLGGIRLDKITPPLIHSYREKRLAGGTSARTVNLDTIALRNVLKLAREHGLIERLPETRQLKQKPSPKRALLTKEEFAALLTAARDDTTKNSALLRFYLRFLALTGSREKETLAIRWTDVDFERATVTIGRGGAAKNHRERAVDFSGELEALLQEMKECRPPRLFVAIPLAPTRLKRHRGSDPTGVPPSSP